MTTPRRFTYEWKFKNVFDRRFCESMASLHPDEGWDIPHQSFLFHLSLCDETCRLLGLEGDAFPTPVVSQAFKAFAVAKALTTGSLDILITDEDVADVELLQELSEKALSKNAAKVAAIDEALKRLRIDNLKNSPRPDWIGPVRGAFVAHLNEVLGATAIYFPVEPGDKEENPSRAAYQMILKLHQEVAGSAKKLAEPLDYARVLALGVGDIKLVGIRLLPDAYAFWPVLKPDKAT